ncbi:hypothetical protein OV079_28410 [Nannocystis pusilla]|uniref:ABC transporter domain-containing protein n=1 Tax=Nannocystis pusilla TaxID=889268 RepID=A0A9X3IZD7_9BACT|nr:ATP-binding cassette domain-containing protein [Nannocystis pusilla]MCY1009416.1 hypothetical protein [Nannocystis pusilla]
MTETTTTASFHLELFSIESMFNRTDVEIIPKDNRLILVGENGSGKSTILNILYLFLTAQWKRLAKLPFRSVKARINGQDLVIRRDDIIASHRAPQIKYMNDYLMHRRRLTPDTLDAIITDIQELSPAKLMHDYVTLRYLAQKHEVDPDDLQEIFYLNLRMSGEVDSSAITRLQNLEKTIARLLPSQVLFLPTYRRIERDLKSIFPNLRLEQELKQFHRPGTSGPSCIELVEFGMKDVEETFAKKTQSLSESLRADLDNMTGSYLSDVIRKEYKKPDLAALIAPGVADAVNDVIDKIDARFLSDTDRGHLKQIMQTLQESRDAEDEQVTVHYLTKLAKVRANQQKREENVRAFVSLCNKYLQDKFYV